MSSTSISPIEYHVLLAMVTGPRYGYAIKETVEVESNGVLSPPAGTLYRVIARLMDRDWVVETDHDEAEPHPGLARRYYRLTAGGRAALSAEADRLRAVSDLARRRLSASSLA
jgi:PadR family transcriptional regulator, regulatory protein PadR